MKTKERVLFPNQVEVEKFCKKMFAETGIAPCNSEFVCATEIRGASIFRKPCHRKFYSSDIVAYQQGEYALIYRAHSEEILFIYENKGNYEIFPWDEDGFYLKKRFGDNFEIDSYKLTNDGWEKTCYRRNHMPKGYEEKRRTGRPQEWHRVHPYKEGVKSIDNTIYYGYVVPLFSKKE